MPTVYQFLVPIYLFLTLAAAGIIPPSRFLTADRNRVSSSSPVSAIDRPAKVSIEFTYAASGQSSQQLVKRTIAIPLSSKRNQFSGLLKFSPVSMKSARVLSVQPGSGDGNGSSLSMANVHCAVHTSLLKIPRRGRNLPFGFAKDAGAAESGVADPEARMVGNIKGFFCYDDEFKKAEDMAIAAAAASSMYY